MASPLRVLSRNEQLNFLLTNRIPRRLVTRFMGWFSKLENRWLTRCSLFIWQRFTDIDLSDAVATDYRCLHAVFTRQLRPGARPVDRRPAVVVSPCDGIVVACGDLQGTTLFQAKGFPFELEDLMPDAGLREKYRNGRYVTLRLTSAMYHRFHAPLDCSVRDIHYIAGDTWNVNPVALKRIERLYCKNERAVIDLQLGQAQGGICLVPVAAILVASIHLHALAETLDMHYLGPKRIPCNARYRKGDELGYFQHGSTLLVFATREFALHHDLAAGDRLCMGEPLLVNTALPDRDQGLPH